MEKQSSGKRPQEQNTNLHSTGATDLPIVVASCSKSATSGATSTSAATATVVDSTAKHISITSNQHNQQNRKASCKKSHNNNNNNNTPKQSKISTSRTLQNQHRPHDHQQHQLQNDNDNDNKEDEKAKAKAKARIKTESNRRKRAKQQERKLLAKSVDQQSPASSPSPSLAPSFKHSQQNLQPVKQVKQQQQQQQQQSAVSSKQPAAVAKVTTTMGRSRSKSNNNNGKRSTRDARRTASPALSHPKNNNNVPVATGAARTTTLARGATKVEPVGKARDHPMRDSDDSDDISDDEEKQTGFRVKIGLSFKKVIPFLCDAAVGCAADGRHGEAQYINAVVDLFTMQMSAKQLSAVRTRFGVDGTGVELDVKCRKRGGEEDKMFAKSLSVVRTRYEVNGTSVELLDIKCKKRGGEEDKCVKKMYDEWAKSKRAGVCPFRRGMCIGRISDTYFSAVGNIKFFYASTDELCRANNDRVAIAATPAKGGQKKREDIMMHVDVSGTTSGAGVVAKVSLTEKANGELTMCASIKVELKHKKVGQTHAQRWLLLGSKNVRIALPFTSATANTSTINENSINSNALHDVLERVLNTSAKPGEHSAPQGRFSYLREMVQLWGAKLCRKENSPVARPALWALLDTCTFVGEQVGVHRHIFDAYDSPDVHVFAVLERKKLLWNVGCNVSKLSAALDGSGMYVVDCESYAVDDPMLRSKLKEVAGGPMSKYGEGVVACTYDSLGNMVNMFKFKNQEYAYDRRLRSLLENAAARFPKGNHGVKSEGQASAGGSACYRIKTDLEMKRCIESVTRRMEAAKKSALFACVNSSVAQDRVELVPFLLVYLEQFPKEIATFSDKFTTLLTYAQQLRDFALRENSNLLNNIQSTTTAATTIGSRRDDGSCTSSGGACKSSGDYSGGTAIPRLVLNRILLLQTTCDPLDDVVRVFNQKHGSLLNRLRPMVRSVDNLANEITLAFVSANNNIRNSNNKNNNNNNNKRQKKKKQRQEFGALGIAAPPGYGKSTLLLAIRHKLEHDHGLRASVFDRDLYCTTSHSAEEVSRAWKAEAQACVESGGVALMGNCLDNNFANQLQENLKTKMWLVVPSQVCVKIGCGKGFKRKTNATVEDPGEKDLGAVLFAAYCVERLIAREFTLTTAVMEEEQEQADGVAALLLAEVDGLVQDDLDNAQKEHEEEEHVPCQSRQLKWKMPLAGSTLTMELGAHVVFQKYFSTGPGKEMLETRESEGSLYRVSMLDPFPVDFQTSPEDQRQMHILRSNLLKLKSQMLETKLSQQRSDGGLMTKPLVSVIAESLQQRVMFVGATPNDDCKRMMLRHADQCLQQKDGHITLAYKPTLAQLRAFEASCSASLSAVGDGSSTDDVCIPLVALVTVRTCAVNSNNVKKAGKNGDGGAMLQFLAADIENESTKALFVRFKQATEQHKRPLHVTLGTSNANVLAPSTSGAVLYELVNSFGTRSACANRHHFQINISVIGRNLTSVTVDVRRLENPIYFTGQVNAYVR